MQEGKGEMDTTEDTRHAIVVVGMDGKHGYMNDQSKGQGKNFRYPWEKFMASAAAAVTP